MNRPDWPSRSVSDSFRTRLYMSDETWPKMTSNSKSMKFDESRRNLQMSKNWWNIEKVTEMSKCGKRWPKLENRLKTEEMSKTRWPKHRNDEKMTETSKGRKINRNVKISKNERRRKTQKLTPKRWHRPAVMVTSAAGAGHRRAGLS